MQFGVKRAACCCICKLDWRSDLWHPSWEIPSFLFLSYEPIREAVYTAQVFGSNETLFVMVQPSFYTRTRCWSPRDLNFLELQASLRLCKLARGLPANTVTTLMLMLAQVSAFCSSHYQALIKHSTVHWKQVNMTTVCWGKSVHSIILEVNLGLNFFNLWLLRA